MTSRWPRLVLAALTLNAALLAGALTAPLVAVGCSCVAPQPGAPIFSGDEGAVLVGTVGADDGRGVFAFHVERWFRGGTDAVVRMESANQSMCGVDLKPGQHLILTAFLADGRLSPSICSPHAGVESGEGQAMLTAALGTFGPGIVPGEPPPGVADDALGIDLALVAIVTVVGLLALVVVGVVVSAIGRREQPDMPRQ